MSVRLNLMVLCFADARYNNGNGMSYSTKYHGLWWYNLGDVTPVSLLLNVLTTDAVLLLLSL
jgi:hypothetical protein